MIDRERKEKDLGTPILHWANHRPAGKRKGNELHQKTVLPFLVK